MKDKFYRLPSTIVSREELSRNDATFKYTSTITVSVLATINPPSLVKTRRQPSTIFICIMAGLCLTVAGDSSSVHTLRRTVWVRSDVIGLHWFGLNWIRSNYTGLHRIRLDYIRSYSIKSG